MKNQPAEKAPAQAAPQSADDCAEWIGRIGDARRELTLIEAAYSERSAQLKEQAEGEAKPHKERLERLKRGVQMYCEANREALLKSGRKTAAFATGEVSWRLRPPSVRVASTARVLAALKRLGLARFIRTREEVNKEALLAEPGAAAEVKGLTIGAAGEVFSIMPHTTEINEEIAA